MFSKILKDTREDNDQTQEDLAKSLGIAKSTVSNWEQNKSRPSFEVLCQICDLYGVSADYMLGRTNDDLRQKLKRFDALSEENKNTIRKFENYLLSEQQKEAKK